MTTLVLADHDNSQLAPSCARVVSAAAALGNPVTVLVAGADCAAVAAAAARLEGVETVLLAEHEHFAHGLAAPLASLLAGLSSRFNVIMAASSTTGKDVMPRVAALVGAAQLSELVGIEGPDLFVRAAYAGNGLEVIRDTQPIRVLTVRASAFEPVGETAGVSVQTLAVSPDAPLAQFVDLQESVSDRPGLDAARVVVAGGRALGSKEQFESVIGPLADKLNAAIGASRAAVDAGFISNDFQVGQTGRIVAPEIYIACGISGAVQHIAGMKNSKIIVAINSDPEAPIFEYADFGLVGNIFDVLPELAAKL